MKKLWLLPMTAMFAVTGCVKNDAEMSGPKADAEVKTVPHIYGWATLDDSAPQTRGIALRKKKWGGSDARDFITVKFLNGVEPYKKFVKEVAHEWELYGNVKFHFLEDDAPEAVVRIAFDNKDMKTTWSLTGTDHIDVIDYQNEPTMHFAQWSGMTSNAKRRSDVLRAFGQVLGLELEFRHPDFTPGWITDENGNIDEEYIREYWEDDLQGVVPWETLKTYVLDPLENQTMMISQTAEYDPESKWSGRSTNKLQRIYLRPRALIPNYQNKTRLLFTNCTVHHNLALIRMNHPSPSTTAR